MKQKVSVGIWRLFAGISGAVTLITVILCIVKTKDGITVGELMPPFLVSLAVFGIVGVVLVKLEGFLEKYQRFLLPVFFVVYGLLVYRLCLHSRGIPVHDSLSIINGAKYMAGLTEEMNWTYFARYNNNLMPMIYLGLIFRFSNFLGVEDGWYIAVAINVLMLLAALFCVFKLSGRISKHGTAASWLGILMLAVYFPVLGHTQSLYTDAFSFCFGITAFYVWLRNQEKHRTGWRYHAVNILAGILWAVGIQLKMTVAISLIAAVIYLLLFEKCREALRKCGAVLLVVIIAMAGCRMYAGTLPTEEYKDTWALPGASHFIALGLSGDGGFDMYSEYFETVTAIYGMDEKKAYIRDYIWENKKNFINPGHVLAKLRNNYAEGTMGASIFLNDAEGHGLIYNCISYNGAYSRTYRTWIDGYWYMILTMAGVGFVSEMLSKREERDACRVTAMLCMVGIMMYVMLSEANNRQLYNHLPWIIYVANTGMWVCADKIKIIRRKR